MPYLATIIIPSMLSNLDNLRACLDSLGQQELAKSKAQQKLELLIVANTDLKKMRSVERSFNFANSKKQFDCKWLCMKGNTGFVGATNAGIKQAQAELIVFLNDDTVPDKNWLKELFLVQSATGADMVASKIYLADKRTLDSEGFGFAWRGKAEALRAGCCSLSNDRDYWLKNLDLLGLKNAAEPFGPDGAAALYTRKLFDKIGLLEKDFFAYLEDVDLALRARQAGMKCVLAEKAIIYHYKHASSSKMSGFKARQDFKNWWKIVRRRYNIRVWQRFYLLILLERLKNLAGWWKNKRN